MQIGANQSYLLGLFNTTNTTTDSAANNYGIIDINLSVLDTPVTTSSSSSTSTTPTGPTPPTAPWSSTETSLQASSNVQNALAGLPIVSSTSPPVTPSPGITASDAEDYSNLFALYQGLTALNDVATQAKSTSNSPQQQAQLENAFSSGLSQVNSYVSSTSFSNLRLAFGQDATSATAQLTTTKPPASYTFTTAPLATTDTGDVPAFDGNVQFNMAVTLNSTTQNIPIDLSGMGAETRSMGNVVNYINQQLSAAGVGTRVSIDRVPGTAQTISAGGSTITLPTTPDEYSLQVNVGESETVSFSAPQTAGAVYVAQTGGNPNPPPTVTTNSNGTISSTVTPDTRVQFQKFQTDTTNVDAPPQTPGQANYTQGRVFSNNLDPDITSVQAEQVGSDGSVYMLANVNGAVEGQTIQGTQDVALLKYDSSGNLVYTRTLGASSSATGLGLAVSSTGEVAVVGSVTGALTGATEGALNAPASSGDTNSFVTLYDANGNEVWTESRGSDGNNSASQVAFSANGSTVYVGGQAQGDMPGGGAAAGGQNGYIEGFTTSASGTPQVAFTQSFGPAGQDSTKGMVVDGNSLITASVENGDAVLSNYDISSGTPVLTNTRNLGSLQGGSIAGLSLNGNQIVVAGTTTNTALSAGTVTSAATGTDNAFVAQLNANLTPASSDAIAYYGNSGQTQATSLSVSNGQVWIGGTTTAALPGQTFSGDTDGYIAQLNVATGQVVSSNEFTGSGGYADPTVIAANSTGSSVLDRLGLPEGAIGADPSQDLVAQSSLRPGDQFTVSAGTAPPTTITINATDTLSTIAQEIQRATGNEATATVTSNASGQQTLTIKPAYTSALVTLGAGPSGKNALATLGLPQGVLNQTVTNNNVTAPGDGGSPIYGLGLSSTLNLSTTSEINQATAAIGAAMGEVRKAYQGMVTAETPKIPGQTAAAAAGLDTGSVPAYLSAELANLQAGLARLTSGSTSSTTSTLI